MKRIFAAAAVMVFLISTAAFAGVNDVFTTNARLDGLQLQNWQTEDDYVIWFNPGRIVNYKNHVYGELGTWVGGTADMNDDAVDKWAGANYATTIGTFGLYLSRPYSGPAGYGSAAAVHGPAGDVTVMDSDIPTRIAGIAWDGASMTFGTPVALPAGIPAAPAFKATTNPSNKFDLFYGKGLPIMNIGVRVSLALFADDDDISANQAINTTTFPQSSETNNSDSSDITIAAGAQFKTLPLDVAVIYGMPSLTKEHKVDTKTSATAFTNQKALLESDGANNIGILARLITGNLFTTLGIGLINDSSKATYDYSDDTNRVYSEKRAREEKTTGMRLDTAYNAHPNADTLFLTSVGLNYATQKTEITATRVTDKNGAGVIQTFEGLLEDSKDETTTLSIPLVIAVEHQTFKVAKTRFSIYKPIYESTKRTNTDDQYGTTGTTRVKTDTAERKNLLLPDTPASIALGLGVDFGKNITLDATINQDILFTGTWLISGIQNTLAGKISAVYRF